MVSKFSLTGKCLLIGTLVLGSFAACSLPSKKEAIVIEKEPPTITRHPLEQASIRLQDQSRGEGALTTWFFRCSNHLAYEVKSETTSNKLVSAEIIVTGVTTHIGLVVDIFLKDDAPEKLKAHEQGHRRICELIYESAEGAAKKAAQSVLGRRFSGVGASRQQALGNALQTASEADCLLYRSNTVDIANKTSDAFDRVTNHGRAGIGEEDALNQAFSQQEP